jgi:ketosteroid isomerase-like protein
VADPIDVVRRCYAAFQRQDVDAFLALFHPEVEVDLSRTAPDLGIYHGLDGLVEGWRKWRGAWERYDAEIEELVVSGDRVLGLVHINLRSRGQGIDTELVGADLFTVRDGLIVRFANYFDRDEARRDAGF